MGMVHDGISPGEALKVLDTKQSRQ
jgi:hypothetical protein